jgi:hypothetical protein
MNLPQFLRRHALPSEKVKVVGKPKKKELLGKTGTLIEYTNANVLIDGQKYNLTMNSLRPTDQTEC